MKTVFAAMILLGSALVATAGSDNAMKLVGVWELVKSDTGGPPGATVEFGKDGKFKVEAKDIKLSMTGTYKVKGDVITLSFMKGDKTKESPGTIKKLTDKELHVADDKGRVDEFKRVK